MLFSEMLSNAQLSKKKKEKKTHRAQISAHERDVYPAR